MKRSLLAVIIAAALTTPAGAAKLPFTDGFDGWEFFWWDTPGKLDCEAKYGNHRFLSRVNGATWITTTMPAGMKNKSPNYTATLKYNGGPSNVTAFTLNNLLYFKVNPTIQTSIAYAKGFTYEVNVGRATLTGTVKFNKSAPAAYQTMSDCIMSIGG